MPSVVASAAKQSRVRRAAFWIASSLVLLAMTAGVALIAYAKSLPPLDLAAAAERSTVVLDREGKLLRPFVTDDGRWKLPVTAADVDPRYLAMLKAYRGQALRRSCRHRLGSASSALPARCWRTAASSPAARR
jgi:penicillin-binding protein 1C